MDSRIVITYKNDKTLTINLPEDAVQRFLDAIWKGDVYTNTEGNPLFWTAKDDIRHVVITANVDAMPTVEDPIDPSMSDFAQTVPETPVGHCMAGV